MKTVTYLRHGQSVANANGILQGHYDTPLSEQGRTQAREVAECLDGDAFDAILSSDLLRAKESAEIIGEKLGLPVKTDAGLREIDVGEFSGLNWEQIEERWPNLQGEGWDRFWSLAGRDLIPGQELYGAFEKRILSSLDRLVEAKRTLLVGHGAFLEVLLASQYGAQITRSVIKFSNMSRTDFLWREGRPTFLSLNLPVGDAESNRREALLQIAP